MAENLPQALAIYADVLRRPHLPEDQLEASRLAMLQELRAVEDEPAQKVMIEAAAAALSRAVGPARPKANRRPWKRPRSTTSARRSRAVIVPTGRSSAWRATWIGRG